MRRTPRESEASGTSGVVVDPLCTLLPQAELVCFSHLRWSSVLQRPHHLMLRCARQRRVLFYEEPEWRDCEAEVRIVERAPNIWVATPILSPDSSPWATNVQLTSLVDRAVALWSTGPCIHWFYSPMALPFTSLQDPALVIYDCMDDLSALTGAPPQLRTYEAGLFELADLVFTGGRSLYEAKRSQRADVHCLPNSVDFQHFAAAREELAAPADQRDLPRPRLGFCGVIDERVDLALLDQIARRRPDWSIVVVGQVARIAPASLPRAPNLHFLGARPHAELPSYLAGWDVALLPFARNDATRLLSPARIPEYLAAGRPVVSTSVADVVKPYGEARVVRIADEPGAFVDAIGAILAQGQADRCAWLARVDALLAGNSWERTWTSMTYLMALAIRARAARLQSGRSGRGT